MNNYELAFRMQMQVPGILDLGSEDEHVKESYGIGREPTDSFGRKCLLARRLIEKGVRFVQLFHGSWDSHDFIERAHGNLVRQVDQPIAGLLTDLRGAGCWKRRSSSGAGNSAVRPTTECVAARLTGAITIPRG